MCQGYARGLAGSRTSLQEAAAASLVPTLALLPGAPSSFPMAAAALAPVGSAPFRNLATGVAGPICLALVLLAARQLRSWRNTCGAPPAHGVSCNATKRHAVPRHTMQCSAVHQWAVASAWRAGMERCSCNGVLESKVKPEREAVAYHGEANRGRISFHSVPLRVQKRSYRERGLRDLVPVAPYAAASWR